MSATEPLHVTETILVVDDDAEVREVLREQLEALGYQVLLAPSATEALAVLEVTAPDLVLTDVHMGTMSGVELCAALKRDARFQLIPVILLTAVSDLDARVAGLESGADDFFAKPVELIELRTRVAALLKIKALTDQLERAESLITALATTIEARDPYTGGHCERLSRYAVALGQALDMDGATVEALRLGGYLHDLGKIAVPDGILLKPGPLDAEERGRMQTHPVAGADLARRLRTMEMVWPIIRHHHECWNGSGYPDGLHGETIPIGARVMAVVDVYDALTTARPYKAPLPHAKAMEILQRESDDGAWDPVVVTRFVELMQTIRPHRSE